MELIRVLLEGGPTDLTGADRVHEVEDLSEPVKVPRGSGREHFRHSGEYRDLHGSSMPVFQWCDRTKIAE